MPSKWSQYEDRAQSMPRPWEIHPAWRGIGCILMVIIPVMAYAGAVLLIQANFRNGWIALPQLMVRPVFVPQVGTIPHLYGTLATAVILALAGFAVLTIIYAVMYNLAGPPKYGPVDSPPYRRKVKKSR